MLNNTSRFLFVLLILAIIVIPLSGQQERHIPTVKKNVFFGKSKPVREMKVVVAGPENRQTKGEVIPNYPDELPWDPDSFRDVSSTEGLVTVQDAQGSRSMGGPLLNFEGMDNVDAVAPGDPNGDMGTQYYMQTINRAFSVYDRNGELVYGPVDNTSIWDNFPGPWDNVSWGGDPVFKYDHLAERWVVSAFSVNSDQDIYYEMIAVSVTSDPLGEYYTYAFQFDEFPDYPKLAIWPDGYYLTYKINGWRTTETAVDRVAMLNGEEEVSMVVFEDGLGNYSHNPLSVDIEGFVYDSATPNYVILPVSNPNSNPVSAWMYIYEFKPDWSEPDSSTFSLIDQLSLEPVSVDVPPGVVQPEDYNLIDALWIRFMYPASYRKFEDHESIVATHTLWKDDGTHLMRWYEVRRDADSGWYIYQQSGYSPDSLERWMGSINMNVNGDIALGYSASGEETYASIRYTGRLAEDSLNKMTFTEVDAFKGMRVVNNVSGSRNRWGDYASMSLDPADDSTFWFTTMYPTASGGWGNWSTRIISFNLHEEGPSVYVDAGPPDTMICLWPLYEAYGLAENYSSANWTSSGDGSFIVTTGVNNTYYYGQQDYENEEVTLYLTATGYEPGSVVIDSLHILLNKEVAAFAGNDTLICSDESYILNGTVEYAYDYYWSTTGDGIFSDSTALDAIYTPGAADIDSGQVTIMLHALHIEPCEGMTTDTLLLNIDDCTYTQEITANDLSVRVSPNPVDNVLSVSITGITGPDFSLELLNLNGRQLFADNYGLSGDNYRHQLDLSHIPPGLYLLRIRSGNYQKTVKIIRK
jgi:hypothetical protein